VSLHNSITRFTPSDVDLLELPMAVRLLMRLCPGLMIFPFIQYHSMAYVGGWPG